MKIFVFAVFGVILLINANLTCLAQNQTVEQLKDYKIDKPQLLLFTDDDYDEDTEEMETIFNLVKNLSFNQKDVDTYLSLLSDFSLENMTNDLGLPYTDRSTVIYELSTLLTSRTQKLLISLVINGFQEIYDYHRGYYEPMTETEINNFLKSLDKEQLINLIIVMDAGEWAESLLGAMRQALRQADSGKLRALAINWGYLAAPKSEK